jgi:hypothetical protein
VHRRALTQSPRLTDAELIEIVTIRSENASGVVIEWRIMNRRQVAAHLRRRLRVDLPDQPP